MAVIDLGTIDLGSVNLGRPNLGTIDFGGAGSTYRRGADFLALDFNEDFRIEPTS